MKTKKIIAGILTAATLVAGATSAFAAESANFTDVTASQWYAEAVSITNSHGIMSGIGGNTFDPNGVMTRAQVVQVLYNNAGKPTVNELSTFTDVAGTAWYAKAVAWAQKNNVVGGIGDNKFAPEQKITREAFAAMLYRAEGNPAVTGNLGFKDAATVSSWANNAMLWATQKKIIGGALQADGTLLLNPISDASRAETAQMLANYLEISQRGHVYAPTVIKQATATEDGVMRYTCSICKHTYDAAIKAGTEHNYVITQTKKATCTADGSKTYTCQDCGDKYTETIPATGHDYRSVIVDGVKITSCETCGDTYKEPVSTEGHSYIKVITKDATCGLPGTAKYTCSICGDSYTEIIPMLGHDYAVTKTKDATCTVNGYKTHTCTRCGRSYKERIDPLGHKYVVDGVNHKMVCSTCGDTVYAKE